MFRQVDFPEAGIQVPAGTVMPNEELTAAVLREAHEETGLERLVVKSYLGEQLRNMQDFGKAEVHQRHFFHLSCEGTTPTQWQHDENHAGDGDGAPIRFEFFWAKIPDQIPELIGDHDVMVPRLERQVQNEKLTP